MDNTITMKNLLWSKTESVLQKAALLIAGVVVLAFASQLSIPLQPVPLTFQSATAILIGMAYGPRYGSYVILGYYMAALCGLPVLANMDSGIAHFFGPTGGYLIGFLPAAFVSGYLAQKGLAKNFISSFIAASAGTIIIFCFGVAYLTSLIGFQNAITFGLLPFLTTEFIKLAALSIIIPRLWK